MRGVRAGCGDGGQGRGVLMPEARRRGSDTPRRLAKCPANGSLGPPGSRRDTTAGRVSGLLPVIRLAREARLRRKAVLRGNAVLAPITGRGLIPRPGLVVQLGCITGTRTVCVSGVGTEVRARTVIRAGTVIRDGGVVRVWPVAEVGLTDGLGRVDRLAPRHHRTPPTRETRLRSHHHCRGGDHRTPPRRRLAGLANRSSAGTRRTRPGTSLSRRGPGGPRSGSNRSRRNRTDRAPADLSRRRACRRRSRSWTGR